jgi:hypothetical protein
VPNQIPREQTPDYYVAPFAIDGECMGVGGQFISELSPRWLTFCRQMLNHRGPVFRCTIPLPPLAHIGLQFTSQTHAALVSFTVHSHPATSAVALRGTNLVAEAEVLKMFVDSLRRVPVVQQAAASRDPFGTAFGLVQRPIYIVVPWANPEISEADQNLVRELNNHTAATFLGSDVSALPPRIQC